MPAINGYRDYDRHHDYNSYDPYRSRDQRPREGGAYGTYDRQAERDREDAYGREPRDTYEQRSPQHEPYREPYKEELYAKVVRDRPRGPAANGAGHRDPPVEVPRGYRVAGSDYQETVMYELDHLATFTVGAKQGLMYPEDGIKKLRQMNMQTGIWTMRVQLMIERRDIVIIDRQTADEMERFPLDLVREPTAVSNNDRRDVYNNVILFTVQEDSHKGSPAEMHIFQVLNKPAQHVVDDIKASQRHLPPTATRVPAPRDEKRPVREHIELYEEEARKMAAATKDYQPGPNVRQEFTKSMRRPDDSDTIITERTDGDVELLNHCFDDIEKFVGRLQQAADAFKDLDRRRRGRDRPREKRPYKHGEGMLTMRARPPPAKDFIDVFQKFKLSFNLLAKLKPHIHDPNAPELVHFLFTPLSLVVEASKDPRHGTPDLATKVVSPLLSADAKDLLMNCLTSKEADLWTSLGDAWTISRDQWKGYVPPYTPRFSDGWKPNPAWLDGMHEGTISGGVDAARTNRRSGGSDPTHDDGFGHQYNRYDDTSRTRQDDVRRDDPYQRAATQERSRDPYSRDRDLEQERIDGERERIREERQKREQERDAPPQTAPKPRTSFESAQLDFLHELRAKGAKVYEATHVRDGRNAKELSVQKDEIIEVIDDTRNWWKLRNYRGDEGHAPYTILQPYKDPVRP